jgi:hypothetical protein
MPAESALLPAVAVLAGPVHGVAHAALKCAAARASLAAGNAVVATSIHPGAAAGALTAGVCGRVWVGWLNLRLCCPGRGCSGPCTAFGSLRPLTGGPPAEASPVARALVLQAVQHRHANGDADAVRQLLALALSAAQALGEPEPVVFPPRAANAQLLARAACLAADWLDAAPAADAGAAATTAEALRALPQVLKPGPIELPTLPSTARFKVRCDAMRPPLARPCRPPLTTCVPAPARRQLPACGRCGARFVAIPSMPTLPGVPLMCCVA